MKYLGVIKHDKKGSIAIDMVFIIFLLIIVGFAILTLAQHYRRAKVYQSQYHNNGVNIQETIASNKKTLLIANAQQNITLDRGVTKSAINQIEYYFLTIQGAKTQSDIKIPCNSTQILFSSSNKAVFQCMYDEKLGYSFKITLPNNYSIKDMESVRDTKNNPPENNNYVSYTLPILLSPSYVGETSSSSNSINDETEEIQQTQTTVEDDDFSSTQNSSATDDISSSSDDEVSVSVGDE